MGIDLTTRSLHGKPTKRYIARAVPRPDGTYLAEFAFPGGIPVFVSQAGTPLVFRRERDAETEAALALACALGNRTRVPGKPERYAHMAPEEFAVALAELGLSATQFAWLYGTKQERVLSWIDGTDNVPHPARLLLALLADDRNRDTVERVTKESTSARDPDRNPA